MKTIIFTDGSSRGNPGPGGWGAIVAYPKDKDKKVKELGGRDAKTTNNRMEMTAVIEGLSFAKKVAAENDIILYTDSEYVKKGATEWARAWASNNWRTKANTDVLNKDLWQKMIELVSELQIHWVVVPGHAGVPANERCDVIATTFADGSPAELYDGAFENYTVSLEAKSALPNKGSLGKSAGTKAYSYVSAVKGIVKVHKTWAECEARVKGESSARFRKALSREDEAKLIEQFGR